MVPTAHLDARTLHDARARVVRDALPGLTSGLALLQSLLAVFHATLGGPLERPLAVVDAASAVVALGLRLALGRAVLKERWAHPFCAACGAIAVAVVLEHLFVLKDPLQGVMLALVLLGAGSMFLSQGWLALLAAPALLGWLAVTDELGRPAGSFRVGIELVGSWGLAAMILAGRRRAFDRLEELRAQNEQRLTQDVAEARRVAELMRQSEESHRVLFEQSPLAMWAVARDTLRFLAVNDQALRQYGYSRAEFLELTLRDVHAPEHVPTLMEDLAREPAGPGSPIVRQHRRKDGTLIDVEVAGHRLMFGEWDARLYVLTDVTERKRAEEALRRSQESFQQLFEEAPIGMATIAAGTTFERVNRALCQTLGRSKEELIGSKFERFIEPADREAHLAASREFLGGTRSAFRIEARYLRDEREPFWGSLTVERVLDSAGRLLFTLVMFEDISERRQAAQERERIIAELQQALANVKTLRGLVPICAACKKVRDDKGYWNQVEVYVRDRSLAEFSHGMCPDCMKSYYGR